MKIHIGIDSKVKKGKRSIFVDGTPSHNVSETELQEVLKESRLSSWRSNLNDGVALGQRLFELFNGSGGQLRSAMDTAYAQGDLLYLYFYLPYEFDALPVELLCDQHFFALKSDTHVIRQVTEKRRLAKRQPEKRPLKLLFTASSPLDLSDSVLEFEKEEESIQKEIGPFQVDMTIEDSGSLEGLHTSLIENNGFDIVHLTGHAGIDHEFGPVFYMENEFGGLDKVTPERLATILRDYPPQLLFLSGCSTAKSDKPHAADSFSLQLVAAGGPLGLGWALPVSDVGATLLTIELYRYLGQGKPVDFAVQRARQAVENHYHPWPLLRLFSDGSQFTPLIAPGQPLRPKTHRATAYKVLTDSEVRVLEYGFVGRRREIQAGVRVLRGFTDKHGVLIRGPAGVGKSCLAGKLIERLSQKEVLVFHGELRKADILLKLKRLFDKSGLQAGVQIIKSELEYEDKIKALFRTTLKELPTLIYFDDFEQNLTLHGDNWQLKPGAIEVVRPFLYALPWCDGKSYLLLTSRYPFLLEWDGEDLADKGLQDVTLMSFRDADLQKKRRELPAINNSAHAELYFEFGKGNPRLLEWLEKIAEEEEKYDLSKLKKALQGKNEDYVGEYLADILAKTEGEAFRTFLQKAAVFRQPVEKTAYKKFDRENWLERGVDLTLIEREQAGQQEPVYWVTPVIREAEWQELPEADQHEMHKLALTHYDDQLSESEQPDYASLKEAVHHALEAGEIRAACKHAIPLGHYLSDLLLYGEQFELQQNLVTRISEQITSEAMQEKDDTVAALLNNFGSLCRTLGDAKKATQYLEKALEIDLNVFGEKHPKVATDYNNLGLAWKDLGDAKKATQYLEKALEILQAVYGPAHPSTQTVQANLNALTGKA